MKIQATYTFNKTAKTITFTGSTIPATLDKILAVVNTTSNVVIYNPTNSLLGGTYSSPTLTLTYDTSAMADTDKLLIYIEDGNLYVPVQGRDVDNAAQTANTKPLPTGGVAVTSSTYAPAYTVGDAVQAAFDKDNGAQLTNQGNLDAAYDTIKTVEGGTTDATITGFSYFRSTTGSSTAETIKASGGNIYEFNFVNKDPSPLFIKLYNKTGATSADTPFLTIPLPGGSGSNVADKVVWSFGTACSFRAVTGIADNDTTAATTKPIVEIKYL